MAKWSSAQIWVLENLIQVPALHIPTQRALEENVTIEGEKRAIGQRVYSATLVGERTRAHVFVNGMELL